MSPARRQDTADPPSHTLPPAEAVERIVAVEAPFSLREMAAGILARGCVDETRADAIVRCGIALEEAVAEGRLADAGHIDLFLIAWGVERLAGRRIKAGDYAIDEVAARMAEIERAEGVTLEQRLRGDVPEAWRAARGEYLRLADSIVVDTFDDYREFEVGNLYMTDRAAYRRCREAGRRALARLAGLTVTAIQPERELEALPAE